MANLDTNLLKQAEYARHRHCSREAVRNAVASGRITTFGPDKMIDPTLADAQWQRNTRVRVRSASAEKTIAATNAPAEIVSPVSYDEARRRREVAESSIAEMRQEELQGDLIRIDVIRSHLAGKISAMRDAFLQIPARLVPILVAETDPAKVHTLLEDEIIRAMALVNGAADPKGKTS